MKKMYIKSKMPYNSYKLLSYSNHNHFQITEFKNNQRFRLEKNFNSNNNSAVKKISKKIFRIKNLVFKIYQRK